MENKREFAIEIEGFVEIDIDQEVFDAVTEEWRSKFYDLDTPEKIAQHVAYNAIVNKLGLSDMDGFANLGDRLVKVLNVEWDFPEVDEVTEAGDGQKNKR